MLREVVAHPPAKTPVIRGPPMHRAGNGNIIAATGTALLNLVGVQKEA
jgi:hypothetical protein